MNSTYFTYIYIIFLNIIFHYDLSQEIGCSSLSYGSPGGSNSKESACNAGDPDSIPGSGRSPGKGNGNLLQYYCLENPWTEEPGRMQSMRLQRVGHDSDFTFFFSCAIQLDLIVYPFLM